MKRISIGPKNGLYPSLTTIVGAEPDNRPNWLTIAHVGIMNHATGDIPQYLSIGLNRSHYTTKGIREQGEFSINIPSVKMMQVTDYAGMVSGATTDKSELFPIARGTLKHAPMIANVPLSMECRLVQTVSLGHHEVFIGEVIDTFIDENCLTDGKPDLKKIDPLLFDFMMIDYWSLGQRVGRPWREGKGLKADK